MRCMPEFFCFLKVGSKDLIQALRLARQTLYQLSHLPISQPHTSVLRIFWIFSVVSLQEAGTCCFASHSPLRPFKADDLQQKNNRTDLLNACCGGSENGKVSEAARTAYDVVERQQRANLDWL